MILDVDPGHDDAIAILMAAAAPELDLLAVTVVAGNQTLPKTLRNALTVLTVAGRTEIPVAAGADRPLVRDQVTAPHVHGESGLEGPVLPEPAFGPVETHAVDLIIRLAEQSARPITLIPVGPLTNVALALRKAPRVAHKIERIVLMGGAVTEGNITPAAEFNIFVDPEAAKIVFDSGIPIAMAGLDVTHKAIVSPRQAARFRKLGTPVGRLMSDLLEYFQQFHQRVYGFDGSPLHDPVAVAEVIRPGLMRTRKLAVEVDVSGGPCYGRTVVDLWQVTGREPRVDIGFDLDRAAFDDLLWRTALAYGGDPAAGEEV